MKKIILIKDINNNIIDTADNLFRVLEILHFKSKGIFLLYYIENNAEKPMKIYSKNGKLIFKYYKK